LKINIIHQQKTYVRQNKFLIKNIILNIAECSLNVCRENQVLDDLSGVSHPNN